MAAWHNSGCSYDEAVHLVGPWCAPVHEGAAPSTITFTHEPLVAAPHIVHASDTVSPVRDAFREGEDRQGCGGLTYAEAELREALVTESSDDGTWTPDGFTAGMVAAFLDRMERRAALAERRHDLIAWRTLNRIVRRVERRYGLA